MNKVVDENGFFTLFDEDEKVVTIKPVFNRDDRSVNLSFDGALRTDVQVYLETELNYYPTAHIRSLTVDCGEITAISPGCFGVLLDVKIKLQAIGSPVIFLNKPDCVQRIEKYTKNKL